MSYANSQRHWEGVGRVPVLPSMEMGRGIRQVNTPHDPEVWRMLHNILVLAA